MNLIREIVIVSVPFLALGLLALSFKLDEKKILAKLTPQQEREFEIDPNPVYDHESY